MAAFEYLALDPQGRLRKGVLAGDSSRQVRALLRAQGLQPVAVNGVRDGFQRDTRIRSRFRMAPAMLAMWTRQLATMVRAGMPLAECLRALEEQASHQRRLRTLIADVRAQVNEGEPLHVALAQYPEAFPEMYRVMIEAGESSGRLDDVLERLATYTEEHQTLRQKLVAALIYPCLITLVALAVVIALVTYVVPEVVRVFEQTGQQLPVLTRFLIASSDCLREFGPLMLFIGTAMVGAWRVLLRRPEVRWLWDRALLALPAVGGLFARVEAARVTRALAILASSGVPLLDALHIAARMVSRIPLKRATMNAANSVREGGRFQVALAEAGYFPPMLLHMFAAGEDSGELDDMLGRAAVHQERELQTLAVTFGAMVEPVIILVMGGVVLLIVLAILLPIFEMNQLVGK